MKLQKKSRAVVAAIMMISLVAPTAAIADDDYYRHGNGHGYGHYKHHGGGYYGHGRHGKYVTKNKYKNDNDGEKLLIGLLVGGIVGYAIGDSRNSRAYHDSYAPAPTSPREGYSTTEYSRISSTEGTCLQEREYQNKVIIGGRTVDAYGTACLQPDGSWRYGPAQVASF